MKTTVSQVDKTLFWVLRYLDSNKGWLFTLASGFLLGRFINEFSLPNRNLIDILVSIFSIVNRTANYFSWLSVILLGIPVLHRLLKSIYRKRQYVKLFESILHRHKSRAISQFAGLAWDEDLSLQTCPDLHRGWLAAEVKVQHDTTKFIMPEKYKQSYDEYFDKFYNKKRFFDDGVKFMITRNPTSFSDSSTLMLNTQETLYSQIQFYKDNIAILTTERNNLIRSAVEGTVRFPHTLSMHMIVVTSDDKILITKRSEKVSYSPSTWSCSVEEQLASQDFQHNSNGLVLRWAERLLFEELGLSNEEYNKDNLRVLSVFLESDILNISICAHAVLNIQSSELKQRLLILPRTDYEFSEWLFMSHDDLPNELFHPNRFYHPSSGYRMLMALIKRYGEPVIAEKLLNRA